MMHAERDAAAWRRRVGELPRMEPAKKAAILGVAAAGAVKVKERHAKEVRDRSNPLFWAEYKPVELWTNLFKTMGVTDVFDLLPAPARQRPRRCIAASSTKAFASMLTRRSGSIV